MLYGPITTPACTGADASGAATVTSKTVVTGFVVAAYIQYAGDDPGTTDVTIATLGTSPRAPSYNILVATSTATDTLYLVKKATVDQTGAALTDYSPIPVDDYVTVTVAQANTGDIISVWLMVVT